MIRTPFALLLVSSLCACGLCAQSSTTPTTRPLNPLDANDPFSVAETAAYCEDVLTESASASTREIADWSLIGRDAIWWAVLYGHSLARLLPVRTGLVVSDSAACAQDLAMLLARWEQLERDVYERGWQAARREKSDAIRFGDPLQFNLADVAARGGWCAAATATVRRVLNDDPVLLGLDPAAAEGAAQIAARTRAVTQLDGFWAALAERQDEVVHELGAALFTEYWSYLTNAVRAPESVRFAAGSFLSRNMDLCGTAARSMLPQQ